MNSNPCRAKEDLAENKKQTMNIKERVTGRREETKGKYRGQFWEKQRESVRRESIQERGKV